MSFRLRQLDAKTRRIMALANACLAIGLLLRLFVHPAHAMARDWLDAVIGCLLGFSVVVNLFGLRSARRCRQNRA
jgi:uncharacterized membrane protein YccC